jgi:hypothetical protein
MLLLPRYQPIPIFSIVRRREVTIALNQPRGE